MMRWKQKICGVVKTVEMCWWWWLRLWAKTIQWAISEFPCTSVSKRVLVRNLLMKMSLICVKMNLNIWTHFYMSGFALRLVLKERQKATRKWPFVVIVYENKWNVIERSQNNENGKVTLVALRNESNRNVVVWWWWHWPWRCWLKTLQLLSPRNNDCSYKQV